MASFGTYLANAHTDSGQLANAERVLARVLQHENELAPGNTLRLEWALARTYLEEGKLAIAESYTRRILNRLETLEETQLVGSAHMLLARVLLDQERIAEAVTHLDQSEALLTRMPPVELARLSLGRAQVALAQGDLEEAARRAREALERTEATEPGHAGTAYWLLAQVMLRRGDLNDARFLSQEAVQRLSDVGAPLYLRRAYETLAEVEQADGNLEEAIDALKLAQSAATPNGVA